ncbi:armadillo repeat protein [Xylariaceae sp. FL0255]|nr:armadillo repeat protein [Xylariaceae sp. FL0255]
MALDAQTVLARLRASPSDRLAALKSLRNDLIGDAQKKKLWVRNGVLPHLVRLLHQAARDNTRESFDTLTDDQTAQLQALQLLASFANAGPAFLLPFHGSGALSAVLHPYFLQNEHPDIVLAALRVVKHITAAAYYAFDSSSINSQSLAHIIFADSCLDSLLKVLSQPTPTPKTEAQVAIVAYLVRSLCHEESHQNALVEHGILDALATRLASYAVTEGYVLPSAQARAELQGLAAFIPKPPISSANMEDVLGAIAAIITDSPFRVSKFLYSPSILAIFPNSKSDFENDPESPLRNIVLPGLRPTKPREPEMMDFLLPSAASYPRGQGHFTTFPPSSSRESPNANGRPSSKLQTSIVSWSPPEENIGRGGVTDIQEAESPLVPWMIHLVRTRKKGEQLMAASVLTSLFKTGCAYKTREATIGLLVVPVLMGLLEPVNAVADDTFNGSMGREKLNIIEETPTVLSRLITDSEQLQKAAYDGNAVKILCKLLKTSLEQLPPTSKPTPWSPDGKVVDSGGPEELDECRLGDDGQGPNLIHQKKTREASLKALGALATFKEDFRKAIVNQDAVPLIIECLDPSVDTTGQPTGNASPSSANGSPPSHPQSHPNPVSVIIAACYCVRMLSRSISTLRTALIDHAASKPLLQLLQHPDISVQIAATACTCNLLPDCSPLREPLIAAGVLDKLCINAHSHNAALRLNALWALKHLVDSASVDLKKRCVSELQSDWLVRLICDETEDEALFSSRNRPEQQSAASTSDAMDEDVDMGIDEQSHPWLASALHKATSGSHHESEAGILSIVESRLATLRDTELNPVRKARHDDLAIQEQGLGFIRNLIGGSHSSGSPDPANDTTVMIDYLLSNIGQDRLFQILASKLRPKVLHPFNRRGTSGSETRVLPPQAKIIECVIYILVHIAASVPQHRELVIAQTELLKQLVKLFTSQDREVRVALCHLTNNLTWQDNMNDAPGCSQRAAELKNLGFLKKLEILGNDDEVDVRERAKSALWQMKQGT